MRCCQVIARLIPLLAIVAASLGCSERADLLVVNANIYTVDDASPRASAVAIRDGRFVAVGSEEDIRSRFVSDEVVDAGGATMVPGLIDSHAHLVNYGLMQMNADLTGTTSMDEVIARLRVHEETLPAGEWLKGRGWDQNDWADRRYPTREDIDPIFGDRPVWLERIDGHASLLNSAALRAMGIDVEGRTPDPVGGRIVRTEGGEPTGILIDTASDRVEEVAPPPSEEMIERAIVRALSDAASFGLTGVHEPGLKLDTLQVIRRLVDEGRFTLRMYGLTEGVKSAFDDVCSGGPILDEGGVLTVRAVKLYSDGALGSRGAALLQEYADDPGNTGLMRTDPVDLRNAIEEAIACGFQPAVHAIGDAATRLVLDIYEEAAKNYDLAAVRPRVEHAQVVSQQDLPRFEALGVIAAMQPTHATSDMYWAEDRLGPDRIKGAYAWQTILNTGARVPFGSDLPVESMDPLKGIYAAVTRQDEAGYPDGGWAPHERVSRDQALRGFTIEAAYAAFMEHEVGSVTEGKRADFVLLERDIMTVPEREIPGTRVVATFLSGEKVFGEAL